MTDRVWPEFDLADEVENLTLGEMEEFEDITGLTFSAMSGGFPAKAVTTLMWISYRRTIPDITIEEVRTRTVKDLGGVDVGAPEDPS